MTIKAMKQALEALRTLHDENMDYLTRNKLGGENNQCMVFARETITALRTAIAEAEKQEPVADELIRSYIGALVADKPDEAADATKRMVDYVFATPPAAAQREPLAWAEEIIADLHALYDSEMITENDSGDALIRLDAAICAVEEAEQRRTTTPAAQQEPRCAVIVEVFGKDWRLDYMSLPVGKHRLYTQEYVYTTPPAAQRQPLTEEQIDDIWNRYCDEMGEASINDAYDIARAIEAAHGIGEKT
jgi:hypothetical protein